MNVSRQTALLILGVTLAHLVAIAALSPATQPSRISHPTLFPDGAYAGPAGDTAPVAAVEETIAETRPLPAGDSGGTVDLPARFRELPSANPAAAQDPVAETRPEAAGAATPRQLVPLPRS